MIIIIGIAPYVEKKVSVRKLGHCSLENCFSSIYRDNDFLNNEIMIMKCRPPACLIKCIVELKQDCY